MAVGRVLWWIRTLHIQIRTSRDNSLHAGFLSLPVSDRARLSHVSHILKHIYTHCASWEISGAARCCRVAGVLPGCCRGAAGCCRVAGVLPGWCLVRLPGCRGQGSNVISYTMTGICPGCHPKLLHANRSPHKQSSLHCPTPPPQAHAERRRAAPLHRIRDKRYKRYLMTYLSLSSHRCSVWRRSFRAFLCLSVYLSRQDVSLRQRDTS